MTRLGAGREGEHRVVDEWRDVVLVCSCGWRTADKTKTLCRKSWLEHVDAHAGAERKKKASHA